MTKRSFLAGAAALATAVLSKRFFSSASAAEKETFEITKTPEEWQKILTREQYAVLREEDTERPGSSPLNAEKRAGEFRCAACDLPLFASETKYESGTGWPSFWKPLPNAVGETHGGILDPRVEVHCRRCGGHIGHVFEDGPKPTGLRYCMNGVALKFVPAASARK